MLFWLILSAVLIAAGSVLGPAELARVTLQIGFGVALGMLLLSILGAVSRRLGRN